MLNEDPIIPVALVLQLLGEFLPFILYFSFCLNYKFLQTEDRLTVPFKLYAATLISLIAQRYMKPV